MPITFPEDELLELAMHSSTPLDGIRDRGRRGP